MLLLIPQLVARGYPIEFLALGRLTHNSPRCLPVGKGSSDVITGCASSILLGYVVSGTVCEEYIGDLSHFVTSPSRLQFLHDAAHIGKEVRDGTAKLGLTLSCKSTLLANDTSLGKLIVGHLEAEGVPICQGAAATDLLQLGKQDARQTSGNASEKAGEGRRVSTANARKIRMRKSSHLVPVYGHSAQGAFTAQVNALCRNWTLGTVMGKTQPCAISTVSWFSSEKRVPQIAARVEHVGEWITMWRGFNVDTRRRIRKAWRKIAPFPSPSPIPPPILANDPRRWSKATGPISASLLGSGSGLDFKSARFLAGVGCQSYSWRRSVQ